MTPSEMFLVFRQRCIKFYKYYERVLVPVFKFIFILSIVLMINKNIGYVGQLNKTIVCVGIAFIGMFASIRWIIMILMALVSIHMFAYNILIGIGTVAFCVVLYTMYIRLYPIESILIIITMLALKLNIGYIVPILAALFGGISYMFPIIFGVIFAYLSSELTVFMQETMNSSIENLIPRILSIINKNVLMNVSMLATIGVFIVVFLSVYIIRRLSIDYAPYIAVAVGGAMNLLGFGTAILFLNIDINVFLLVGMTILSVILAIICQFTSKVLDYSRAEVVQFEDEDNYYYVKVVPKVSMNINQKKVEQIYTTTTKETPIHLDGQSL
ncbi:MAG: hypothetical protein ACRC1P_02625 [Cellulosilyticaceae bacterium]